MTKKETEFLKQSNWIEGVYDGVSLIEAQQAWKYILGQEELTVENILHCHKILMQRYLGEDAGRWRKVNVLVGAYRAPDWQLIPNQMAEWMLEISRCQTWTTMLDWKVNPRCLEIYHRNFEKIHPFRDGNGRIGRILWNWQRVKAGLPVKVIYEKDKFKYYELLK